MWGQQDERQGSLRSYGVMRGKIMQTKCPSAAVMAADGQIEQTWKMGVGRSRSEGKGWCGWLDQQEEHVVHVCVCVLHRESFCISHLHERAQVCICQSLV